MHFVSVCLLSCSLAVLASSCRTGQRPNITVDNPIKVEIRMNGIDVKTIEAYHLVAQLKLCADTTGTLGLGTTYGFSAYSLKKDTVCQVRMTGPKAADAGVIFFSGTDDGLYFDSASVTIHEDQNGALTADAYLQKHFTTPIPPQTTVWKIDAPIKADVALNGSCTCRIECAPKIANDASLVTPSSNPLEGNCHFDNASSAQLLGTQCSSLVVQCGGNILAGKWAPPQAADASGGKSQTFTPIKVSPATPTPEGNVVINPEINKTGANKQ